MTRSELEARIWQMLRLMRSPSTPASQISSAMDILLDACDDYAQHVHAQLLAESAQIPSPAWRSPGAAESGPGPTAEFWAAQHRRELREALGGRP